MAQQLTRAKAISKKCFECSGESYKEVTLCHIFDCPLWPYRLGNSPKTKAYKERVEKTIKNHPDDVNTLRNLGIDIAFFGIKGAY